MISCRFESDGDVKLDCRYSISQSGATILTSFDLGSQNFTHHSFREAFTNQYLFLFFYLYLYLYLRVFVFVLYLWW